MSKIFYYIKLLRSYMSRVNPDLIRIRYNMNRGKIGDLLDHIDAAAQWICRAQDATPDDGVARSYLLTYDPYFKKKGWTGSYPETTGYIIPTMFDLHNLFGNEEYRSRAIRMADWECVVQLETGAVQGGTVDQTPIPAIFNTGQVIFGWTRAYKETGDDKYLVSARKAAEFLVAQQDKDGAWRKTLSDYTNPLISQQSYNSRTAWALLYLNSISKEEKYEEAAINNLTFTLSQQNENGWLESNCLTDVLQPLTHTIAYAARGFLESGIALGNETFISAARRTADALISKQREDGSLAGRFNNKWEPTVLWSCLTGNAQIAIIWGKLFLLYDDPKYLIAMEKINKFLSEKQIFNSPDNNINGGITGSYPLNGAYGRYEILNWATKFYIDALLIERSIVEK